MAHDATVVCFCTAYRDGTRVERVSSRARAHSAHQESAKCTGAGSWQVDIGRHVERSSTSGNMHVRTAEAILRLSIAVRVPGGRRGARRTLHEMWQLVLDRVLQYHHMLLLAVLVIQQLRLLRGLRGGSLAWLLRLAKQCGLY